MDPGGWRETSQHTPDRTGGSFGMKEIVVFYVIIGTSLGGLALMLLYWIYSQISGSSESN